MTFDLNSDGTPSSMIPMTLIFLVFFGITTYIGLDQAFGISGLFRLTSGRAEVGQLRNVALWTLGILWPYLSVRFRVRVRVRVGSVTLKTSRR